MKGCEPKPTARHVPGAMLSLATRWTLDIDTIRCKCIKKLTTRRESSRLPPPALSRYRDALFGRRLVFGVDGATAAGENMWRPTLNRGRPALENV
jgi:hypothetical protein